MSKYSNNPLKKLKEVGMKASETANKKPEARKKTDNKKKAVPKKIELKPAKPKTKQITKPISKPQPKKPELKVQENNRLAEKRIGSCKDENDC